LKYEILATIKNFEDLEVWQKSRILCQNIDRYCLKNSKFQKHDQNQIDRASASVMDNIAEGFEREGNREFVNFLTMSKGFVGEVRSQLIRAFDRNYLDEATYLALKEEAVNLSKMLSGFITYLKSSEHKGNKFNRNKENE